MQFIDLGNMSWSDAWARQEEAHARVMRGGDSVVFFVEHPPVITLGRQAELSMRNVRLTAEELKAHEIELVETDRGGNVTFHGPGQLVCYPIVRLSDHRLTVGAYVRMLQDAVIDALARCPIRAETDPGAVGVWVRDKYTDELAKICAIGVRVKRGITMHGLALNVDTDLAYFNTIVPCGLGDRPVTSVKRVLGLRAPEMSHVRWMLEKSLRDKLVCSDAIPLA